MIVNDSLLINYLSGWLSGYAFESGKTKFVIVDTGSRSDVLTHHICSEATKHHGGFGVLSIPSFGEYIEDNESLLVGSIDNTFGLYYRSFGKRREALADIFPLFDLLYSEIVQVTDSLSLSDHFPQDPPDYEMIEFCNRAESLYSIITYSKPPHMHNRWPYFTSTQKKWIAIAHQREKKTRHKAITKPYPVISDKDNLCKRNEQ